MIQRKQTIFLLLAIVSSMACLCLPIGKFLPAGMGLGRTMYNLWIVSGATGEKDFTVWALFAIQLISLPVVLTAIFSFRNRRMQARFCLFNILLNIGWYIVYVAFVMIMAHGESLKPMFASCLPLVSIVLYVLARKGILDDEKLVRAADRIR